MTSIMHPAYAARQQTVAAQGSLQTAALELRMNRTPGIIPEPHDMHLPVRTPSADANSAINSLTNALGYSSELSSGVRDALTRARSEAISGVRLLDSPPSNVRPDRFHIALSFDAAALWAGLAVSLIDLDLNRRTPPAPVQPGPFTPEPPTVTMPNPLATLPPMGTVPVEVEAPESIGA